MNVLVVILVCLVFAFQTGSAIKQSQTLVEIWCGGDDNLTQGVCRALDSEFASSPDFVVSRDEKPGTLIVRISSNVDWKEKGNRTGRFSAKTEYTLQRTGWYPGRQVPDKLASWKSNEMLSHFEMFPTAERILLEFGGLRVDEQGPGETYAREPFVVDPTFASNEHGLFGFFSTLVNTRLYPLGEVDNGNNLWAIGENNHVYLLLNDIQLLGKDIDEALENLIIGRKAIDILPN